MKGHCINYFLTIFPCISEVFCSSPTSPPPPHNFSLDPSLRSRLCSLRYPLRYPRRSFPRVSLVEVTLHYIVKLDDDCSVFETPWVVWWANCLFMAGRVTLSSGTIFSHINILTRLPGTGKLVQKMHAHTILLNAFGTISSGEDRLGYPRSYKWGLFN